MKTLFVWTGHPCESYTIRKLRGGKYIYFQNERGHVSKPQSKEFSYVHKPTLAHSNDICHLFYIYLYFFSWELKFATKLHFNSIMCTKNENIRCMTNPCKVLGQLCQSRGCPPDPNSMHVWYSPTFPFGEAQIHLKWKDFSHLEKMQPCWHRGLFLPIFNLHLVHLFLSTNFSA